MNKSLLLGLAKLGAEKRIKSLMLSYDEEVGKAKDYELPEVHVRNRERIADAKANLAEIENALNNTSEDELIDI